VEDRESTSWVDVWPRLRRLLGCRAGGLLWREGNIVFQLAAGYPPYENFLKRTSVWTEAKIKSLLFLSGEEKRSLVKTLTRVGRGGNFCCVFVVKTGGAFPCLGWLCCSDTRRFSSCREKLQKILSCLTAAEKEDDFCRHHRLSPRHERVLSGLLRGLTDKEIAAKLRLSHQSVRTYVKELFLLTGAHNRHGLVARFLGGESPSLRK